MSGISGYWQFRGWNIPGTWFDGGARWVATAYGWRKMNSLVKGDMCELTGGCWRRVDDLHHPGGRGIGGGKRDDRTVIPCCRPCHAMAEEKRRTCGVQ